MTFQTPAHHYGDNTPHWGLLGVGLSLFYGFLSSFSQARRLEKAIKLPSHTPPIISIGNLTTGGTGKTPVVIALAQYYESLGKRCLVLTRGYGGRPLPDGTVRSAQQGDEAWLIQSALKNSTVLAAANRVGLLLTYLEMHAVRFNVDVIILDDGFQYVSLPRHLNILLVDGAYGFGNGYLLPAGPLREKTAELKRADLVLLTKRINAGVRQKVELMLQDLQHFIPVMDCPFEQAENLEPLIEPLETGSPDVLPWSTILLPPHQENPEHPLQPLQQRQCGVVCGIARPEDFVASLEQRLTKPVAKYFIFPDHYQYTTSDIKSINHWLEQDKSRIMITTAKDAVKLRAFSHILPAGKIWIQPIEPVFSWQVIAESKQLLKQSKPSTEYASPL